MVRPSLNNIIFFSAIIQRRVAKVLEHILAVFALAENALQGEPMAKLNNHIG